MLCKSQINAIARTTRPGKNQYISPPLTPHGQVGNEAVAIATLICISNGDLTRIIPVRGEILRPHSYGDFADYWEQAPKQKQSGLNLL